MSSGREEVDAAVDPAVRYSSLAVDVQLLSQVFLILLVDVLDYWLPAGEEQQKCQWVTGNFSIFLIHDQKKTKDALICLSLISDFSNLSVVLWSVVQHHVYKNKMKFLKNSNRNRTC